MNTYDIVIIGAGPAGTSAATFSEMISLRAASSQISSLPEKYMM